MFQLEIKINDYDNDGDAVGNNSDGGNYVDGGDDDDDDESSC